MSPVPPFVPIWFAARSVTTSPVIRVASLLSSTIAPVVAISVTSPFVVPAFTVRTVMSPALAVIAMSFASRSVVDRTSTTSVFPPVVIAIAPFCVRTSVSSTAFVSSRNTFPATVDSIVRKLAVVSISPVPPFVPI